MIKSGKSRILVIDDEKEYLDTVSALLPANEFDVQWAKDTDQALKKMGRHPADLVLLDLRLSNRSDDRSGLDLLLKLRDRWKRTQVIVFTKPYRNDLEIAMYCMKNGAYFYFGKDWFGSKDEQFVELVKKALTYESKPEPIEDSYPHPLALIYRDYRRNVVIPQLKFRRMIELLELMVKFSAIICLSALREEGQRLNQDLSPLLKPSLGTWFDFLQSLLAPPSKGWWIENIRAIMSGPRRQNIAGLIKVRNDWLGHGATRPEHEYTKIIQRWNDELLELLDAANIFGVWQLIKVKSMRKLEGKYLHTVVNLTGHSPKFLSKEMILAKVCESDQVYVRDPQNEELLSLHPFLTMFICDQCNQETVFLYDKLDRERVLYLDYANGHHSITVETYRAVTQALLGTKAGL